MTSKPKRKIQAVSGRTNSAHSRFVLAFIGCALLISASCTQIKKPVTEPFYAETSPPPRQEFRWSNGKLPQSLDPALAAAPPETDLVRALYEGLTEVDPVTLEVKPGVAESWSRSEDSRVWTFKLRSNARWSDGRTVTAHDFVRAWERLVRLGEKTAHHNLLFNIEGVSKAIAATAVSKEAVTTTDQPNPSANTSPPAPKPKGTPSNSAGVPPEPKADTDRPATEAEPPKPPVKAEDLGFSALDENTLVIRLVVPDPDLPQLVAGPIFRPIAGDGEEFEGEKLNAGLTTNGPFRIDKIDETGIRLVRFEDHWNKDAIRLESVLVVPMESPEAALEAYKAGELDAVTNMDLSPLVLKILSPFDDFRKTTHSALNFYEVNTARAPFSDRRVREALSISIERERLTEGETDGLTRPALQFLPYRRDVRTKLAQDKTKAQDLLREAGFPDGKGFPVIRLLINRNDLQLRIARSVARMWKQNLNLETEITLKDLADVEKTRKAGDYDLVRRGVVYPTSNNAVNMMALLDIHPGAVAVAPVRPDQPVSVPSPFRSTEPANSNSAERPPADQKDSPIIGDGVILSEDEALYELRAIPLYFPTSYALVKPYVSGFEMNSLDVLLLSSVAIDSDWKPKGE
ncbi:MAG: ABC transporter substrate-binding protein [Pyrinomonadaceae bacterium]